MPAEQATATHVNVTRDPSMVMAVTISGGGARAAAFGYGVLRGLDEVRFVVNGRDQTLLESADLVSGVSGGSIIAAYYAAFGREELARFEPEFLRQNFQHGLVATLKHPGTLRELTSPWFGRSNLLQRRLDGLFHGMTFGDLEMRPRHPQLIVTATDLTRGNGFEFTWEQFGLICSDLSSVPLSFAVAASSAVPLALSPLLVRNYSDECPAGMASISQRMESALTGESASYRERIYLSQLKTYLDASERPYIHLVDGGLADNLGVRRLLDRALLRGGLRETFGEVDIPPGSVHRVVLVVVNAARDPARNLDLSDRVPGMLDVGSALLFGTGARATSETQEYLQDVARSWQRDMAARGQSPQTDIFAPGAQIHVITVNLRDAPELERERLLHVATAFSVPDDEVTALIAAGREILHASPDFQALVHAIDGRIEPARSGEPGPSED